MSESNGQYIPDLSYIHDGYTKRGYIAAETRRYQALRFRFRPALCQNRAVIFRRIQRLNDAAAEERLAAQAVQGLLVEWDLRDKKGKPVPMEVAAILLLHPHLATRLFTVIMGDDAGDDDPEIIDGEHTANDMDAVLAGKSPIEAEASEAKN